MISAVFMATLIVQTPSVPLASSAILSRNVKFDNIETLTEKARSGKTRFAGNGSGFFVSPRGDVVTNHHVIDGAEEVVGIWQGTAYKMKVVADDKDLDLALLRPDAVCVELDKDIDFSSYERSEFPAIDLAEDGICKVGLPVFVVGYPQIGLQGMEAKVTKGIVSCLSGFKGQADNFQMDAAIQEGNSGGPVINEKGRLVGVSVARLRGGENVNYAIKMEAVHKFLKDIVSSSRMQSFADVDVIERVVRSSVLILCYEPGSRPLRFDKSKGERAKIEEWALFEKSILHAKMLKIHKEWKDLKRLTDELMKRYGDAVGDDVKELNDLARKELDKTGDTTKRREDK